MALSEGPTTEGQGRDFDMMAYGRDSSAMNARDIAMKEGIF
jgi:hypothetical protein